MKRKFKFRGKNLQTNEWFYGNLLTFYPYLGAGDTVGQYTGLNDKNGREIYEGDIVEYDTILYDNIICTCRYEESTASFMLIENVLPFGDSHYIHKSETGNMKVIGNIYDNPELLEDKQ